MSKRLAWCTDIHFDSAGGEPAIVQLAAQVRARQVEGLLLTGDISTGRDIIGHLSMFERELQMPIYFVGGNHDYYHTSIEAGRRQLKEVSEISQFLRYMPTVQYLALTPRTAVVGHDGWYDALNGNWQSTNFLMNDWYKIQEFAAVFPGANRAVKTMDGIPTLARTIARAGVEHIAAGIKAAVRYHKAIVVLTHFPPWPEAARHEGKISDGEHLPWYTSKMMGDMLLAAAKAYPQCSFTVLCGHTHGRWSGRVAPNMHVHVGGAEYGLPEVQPVIEVD